MTVKKSIVEFQEPTDSDGQKLGPLDIVRINDVPGHWYEDPDMADLKEYVGCYGLITFFQNKELIGPSRHPGWHSSVGEAVHVLARRIGTTSAGYRAVLSWEFWLPAKNLARLDHNYLIVSIFAEYSWELVDGAGPGSHHFVTEGTPAFATIERVLEQSYESLCEAHDAALVALRCT